jgi:hypothetical protein
VRRRRQRESEETSECDGVPHMAISTSLCLL